MKKILIIVLIFISLVLCSCNKRQVDDSDCLISYQRVATGYKVVDYKGKSIVSIPSYYLGIEVVEIADNAFANVIIEEITIPQTVKTIGKDIFKRGLTIVLNYEGTINDFNKINKLKSWESNNMKINYLKEIQQSNAKIELSFNNYVFTATLIDNSSSRALIEKLNDAPIVINMHDYGNFEKVGDLGFDLPRNDESITTEPGDIILYLGRSLTIYYDTNTWEFTRIGRLDNITQEQLKKALGKDDVVVTMKIIQNNEEEI